MRRTSEYDKLIAKFATLNKTKHFKFSETQQLLRSVGAIMRAPGSDYMQKSTLMTVYADQVMQLIHDCALSVDEVKLLDFIATLSDLDNFMGPKVFTMLPNYAAKLRNYMTRITYKMDHLYDQDLPALNRELQRAIRASMKFLSQCGFYRPDRKPINDAQLLSTLQEVITRDVTHMSIWTLEHILYHCAIMGLSSEHDEFIAEVIFAWSLHEDHKYSPRVTKALLYFLKHQDQLPRCAELLNQAIIVENVNKISAVNFKTENIQHKTEQRVKRIIQGVLNGPAFADIKSHLLPEFAVCDWNADFAILCNNLTLTLLVDVDGPHHFVAGNTLQRTPKDLFRHNIMVYCLQLQKDHSVFFRRLTLREADNPLTVSQLVQQDLKAIIDNVKALEAKKKRLMSMRAYLKKPEPKPEPVAHTITPVAPQIVYAPMMFFTPYGPQVVMQSYVVTNTSGYSR